MHQKCSCNCFSYQGVKKNPKSVSSVMCHHHFSYYNIAYTRFPSTLRDNNVSQKRSLLPPSPQGVIPPGKTVFFNCFEGGDRKCQKRLINREIMSFPPSLFYHWLWARKKRKTLHVWPTKKYLPKNIPYKNCSGKKRLRTKQNNFPPS